MHASECVHAKRSRACVIVRAFSRGSMHMRSELVRMCEAGIAVEVMVYSFDGWGEVVEHPGMYYCDRAQQNLAIEVVRVSEDRQVHRVTYHTIQCCVMSYMPYMHMCVHKCMHAYL